MQQKKTVDTDGYEAVALAFGDTKPARLTARRPATIKKAGLEPKNVVREFRRGIDGVEVGQRSRVDGFAEGDRVDVVGISKGHGFAGGIKRHNFQRRRREPRLDDPPPARLERRHERRPRPQAAAAGRDTTASTA